MTTPPRAPSGDMKSFWNEKAEENAMYYISSYRPYEEQDEAEFWRWGEILTARYLEESGIAFSGRERVLEIGCGIGRMTAALARRFAEVTGVDIAEEMIRRAREALAGVPNASFLVGNGVDLAGLADGAFDFVFSYIVFQHIPDKEITKGYIREVSRVLAPGGSFHFQVNGLEETPPPTVGPLARLTQGARRAAGRARRALTARLSREPRPGPRGLDSPAWLGSRFTVPEIEEACRDAGLTVLRTDGAGTQYLWVTARKP